MDVWDWVHKKIDELYDAGEYRLVEIMDDISSFTVDGEHDKVDAIAPEGIALARKLNEKWVEVFLRHWHLQSLVLHRHMPRQALADAVSLLEFSHRDDTRDCPQSICAVQDLANCYDCADSTGYFDERIAVASETLARIDPSWPCYVCIAAEYVSALIDMEKYQEALAFLDKCDSEMLKATHEKDDGSLLFERVNILIRLGELDKARNYLSKVNGDYKGETFRRSVEIRHALLAVTQGEFAKAKKMLPELGSIDASDYYSWFEVYVAIETNASQWQDAQADYLFSKAINTLWHNGAIRDAVNIGFMAVDLAVQRKQLFIAELHCTEVEQLIKELYKDMGASQRLQAARATIDKARQALPPVATFTSVDALLQEIDKEDTGSEKKLMLLEKYITKWPEQEQLLCRLSDLLCDLGKYHESARRLQAFLQQQPDSPQVLLDYGYLLLNKNVEGDLLAFCAEYSQKIVSQAARLNLYWLQVIFYDRDAQYEQACDYINKILEYKPDAFNARLRLSRINRDMQNYSDAADNLDYLLQQHEDKDLKWDRIIIATLQQDWHKVRQLCAELEIDLDSSEGEVIEDWEYIRVRVSEANGEFNNYLAQRSGPVSAIIKSISRIGQRQTYADRVVFEPLPMNRLEQKDAEGHAIDKDGYYTYLYPAIERTAEGGYVTFTLDGVHPGEALLTDFLNTIQQHDIVTSVRSTDEYEITDRHTGETLPGVYVYLLVHQDRDFSEICALLEAQLQSHDLKLIFPELARAANKQDLLEKFAKLKEQYGLDEE